MTAHQTVPSAEARSPIAPERRFLGFVARILANGADTGGLHAVELQLPAGEASPWHVHHEEHEWFYLIEGEIEVLVGESRVQLGAHDFAFGPKDIPHGFRVTSPNGARLLMITEGGRFSDFVAENSEVIVDGQPAAGAPDIGKLVNSAARYGQEILGPLPA